MAVITKHDRKHLQHVAGIPVREKYHTCEKIFFQVLPGDLTQVLKNVK